MTARQHTQQPRHGNPPLGVGWGKPAEHEPYPAEIIAIRKMPYSLKGFRRFAKVLGLKIHPFQAYLLGFYFAGVTELVILISKKNGKTTLLAALALYHLLMVRQAEVVIGAASKEQAALLHRQSTLLIEAAGLVRRALPGDRREPTRYTGVFEIREGMHIIRFEMGRLRVMPHEARTGDGVIPTLALVDELHRHPTGELYEVWRDGLLGNAQMITISTAGLSMDSPLGDLLTKAREFEMEKVKRRRTYTSPDGSFVLVEWALDPEEDTDDMRVVKSVNPAPWHTITTLRRRHDSPSMTVGQWLRMACGIWTEGDEPAITAPQWDALRVDIGAVTDGEPVWAAVRVGQQGGCSIGIAAARAGGVAIRAEVYPYSFPGLERALHHLVKRYDVRMIYVDKRQHGIGTDVLEAAGLPLEDEPQTPVRLMEATATFLGMLSAGTLVHDGDEVLRKQALMSRMKETVTGAYFEPSAETQALIAVVMASHQASKHAHDKPPRIHVFKGA